MARYLPVRAASPNIDRLVQDLLREDQRRLQHDRRSIHRNPFVRPVQAVLSEPPDTCRRGFTKNISALGVGVVLDGFVPERTTVRLFIHRFSDEPNCVVCECRWCDEFGQSWFWAGLNFLHIAPRDVC